MFITIRACTAWSREVLCIPGEHTVDLRTQYPSESRKSAYKFVLFPEGILKMYLFNYLKNE